jgi:hypothetical protein
MPRSLKRRISNGKRNAKRLRALAEPGQSEDLSMTNASRWIGPAETFKGCRWSIESE